MPNRLIGRSHFDAGGLRYVGFKVNSGEYKLMGLAPYGEPRYEASISDATSSTRDDIALVVIRRTQSTVT